MTDEHTLEFLLACRGVRTPCKKCRGIGTVTYGSTATWRGGIGGQAMTTDVCDQCWGSGDADRAWTNIREMEREIAKLKQELAEKLKRL